jgi:hypothetical protein
VRGLNPQRRRVRILSRRALEELDALQATVRALAPPRLETALLAAGSFSGSQEAGQALASLEERSAG